MGRVIMKEEIVLEMPTGRKNRIHREYKQLPHKTRPKGGKKGHTLHGKQLTYKINHRQSMIAYILPFFYR